MPDNTELTVLISQCHQTLNEIFLRHQEAVLLTRLDDAMALFGSFKQLHQLHLDFEDQVLLPKLSTLDNPGRWPESLYKSEHAKIQQLVNRVENSLRPLRTARLQDRASRRAIIAILDQQKTFKGVCEHHQEREEMALLPALDEQADSEWRTGVITLFQVAWDGCMERNGNVVSQMDWR